MQERLKGVPEVLKHEGVLRKARILAMMEHAFMNPDWLFSFEELATVMDAPLEEVEWVVMKAMALSLVKGEIDEVAKTVKFKWLQPRVLDNSRVQVLQERIGLWKHSIHSMLNHLEHQSKELIE